jgi:hypothetical protein
MTKNGRLIYYLIIAALTLFVLVYIFGIENIKEIELAKNSVGVSIGMVLTYILLGLGLIGVLANSIKGMVNNPQSGVRSLIGVGIIAVLFLIGYLIDGGGMKAGWEKFGIDSNGVSKAVGGALIMMYIILFGAVLIAVFGPFLRLFRKN